jgi:hypothetical protein
MGREPWSDRVMVEDCQVISIYDPKLKEGIVETPEGDIFAVSVYRNNRKIFTQRFTIRKSPTKYGGHRNWLFCIGCCRNFAKLYCPPDGDSFKCRKCHNLTYRSQKKHKSPEERFLRRFTRTNREAWQLRDRLNEPEK